MMAVDFRLTLPCACKLTPDRNLEFFRVERSLQNLACADSCRFLQMNRIVGIAKQYNRKIGLGSPQPAQKMQTAHIALRKIQHDEPWRQYRLYPLHGVPTAGGCFDMPEVGLFRGPESAK